MNQIKTTSQRINEAVNKDTPGYISPHDMKEGSFEREMWLLGVAHSAKNITVPEEREQLLSAISKHIQLQKKGQVKNKRDNKDLSYLQKAYDKLLKYDKERDQKTREGGKPAAIIHDGEEKVHEIENIAKKYNATLGNSSNTADLVYEFESKKDRDQFINKVKQSIKGARVGILEAKDNTRLKAIED